VGEDKRKGEEPVPDDVKNYLNEAQVAELHKIEGFGWKLVFVRRPLFQESVVVVTDADGGSIGVLEEDGRLNLDPGIETRQ
jgi:hypothetical protein